MCTLIILRRSRSEWPILIGANREERRSRAFEPPDRHWPDQPDIIGGWDSVGHGSWFAINDAGVMAAVLNRENSLGPHKDKRSRGELTIEALSHVDASAAAESLAHLDPKTYAPFNMVIADNTYACWLKHNGRKIEVHEIPEGYSMLSAHDRNDYNVPRIRTYLPRFQQVRVPDPEQNNWRDWELILSNRMHSADSGFMGAMCIVNPNPDHDYGTVCSQLLAIPHVESNQKPVFLFANGRPGEAPFIPVDI